MDIWEDEDYSSSYHDDSYEFRGKTKHQQEEEMKAKVLKEQEEKLARIRNRIEYEKMLLGYGLKKQSREHKTDYERYLARLANSY